MIERHITQNLLEALQDTPVVFLRGARPQFIKAAAISRAIAAHNRQTSDRKNEGLEFPRALT
jgi:hypothetical protein